MKGVADVFVEAGSIDAALDTYENAVNTGPLQAAQGCKTTNRGPGGDSSGPFSSKRGVGGGAMSGLSIENLSMRFDLPNGSSVQALKDVAELNRGRD
jgi:hypothetical protein